MHETDMALLRRYVEEGAQEAFSRFVQRNLDAVYSGALRRVGGDVHLAQDVTQDVLISLARHARSLVGHPYLGGWLHTATRNAAANRIRGEVRRRRREQEAQTMHDLISDPARVDWSEVAPVLDRALDELSESDRSAILLRFFDRRTFAEIGATLLLSEDAARMRVDRALDKLHLRLGRYGVRSSAMALGTVIAQHAVVAAPAELAATAAGLALAAPATVGTRVGDFLASWRGGETAAVGLAVLATGVALYLAQAWHDEAAILAAVRTTEQRSIASLVERLAAPQQPVPLSSTAATVQPADPTPAERRATARGRLAGGRQTEFGATYDPFYRALGLGPEQIAQFEALVVPDLNTALWVFDHPAPAPAHAASNLPPGETERRLQALLGATGYERYRDFQRVVPARNAIMQVAGAVYLSDPLRREQGDQLTGLFAGSSPEYRQGGAVELAGLDWNALFGAAEKILSPEQMTALSAVLQRTAFEDALARRLNQSGATP